MYFCNELKKIVIYSATLYFSINAFSFQYEVKAPVPSVCFRSICKQIAKLHEALIDVLPPKQVKVSVRCPSTIFSLVTTKEGNVFLTTHSTHFIYGYMVKNHSDKKRGNLLPPHRLLFPISSKGSFICIIPQTG